MLLLHAKSQKGQAFGENVKNINMKAEAFPRIDVVYYYILIT